MKKGWQEGAAFGVFGVLGGAYRGKSVSDRALLTHAVAVDDVDGSTADEKTLCRKILTERLTDSFSVERAEAPTCPECAKRLAR